MSIHPILRHGAAGSALAAALALGLTALPTGPASARAYPARGHARPVHRAAATGSSVIDLSTGRGQLITLPRPMSDLFVANPNVADVQVRSPTLLYVFGKGAGETTVSATAKDGSVVYASTVRVGTNIGNIAQMLKVAMPDAQVVATPMSGMVILTGTVAAPDDVEEASRLVQAFVGKDVAVVSRLKTATPLQVMLKVRFAEVNRSFTKNVGFNFINRDTGNGFLYSAAQGNAGTITTNTTGTTDSASGAGAGGTIYSVAAAVAGGTSFGFMGHLFGSEILSKLDLAEQDGNATTLAQPTLTALSGETASFLAGGEIPIPVPQYQGVTTIDYKDYGVSLAFTPTVLGDGRISLRVRPEVSQLDPANGIQINNYTIPGITTRRAETTVELGSGQSFVIGGLLNNNTSNSVSKAPFLGDLPVLGQLFRSNGWKRAETELIIVVTPYLVKPVSNSQIALPTDGYRMGTDAQEILLDQHVAGKSGKKGYQPQAAPPVTVPAGDPAVATDPRRKDAPAPAAPGFSVN